MGNEYYVYTEAKINNTWFCINPLTFKINKNENKKTEALIAPTYWNGSRTSFSAAFRKIKEEGKKILYTELSKDLQEEYKDYKEDVYAITIPTSLIKKYVSNDDMFECSGFVTEKDIFDYKYEHGEIYEYLTLEEYLNLPEEAQKLYKAFNWNNIDGWYSKFKDIYENNKYVEYSFFDANPHISDVDIRFIVFQW